MTINFPLLAPDQIEVKVKKVNNGSVVLLLYKTARTDMDLLDKAVGPMNWETDYKEIKGNLYCGIGVRGDDGEWVWKWDCGTESRADDEGNQKKGEASDAFKRAGFKWGIGRELYTGPSIVAFVPTEEYRGKQTLKLSHHKYDGFHVADIGYEDSRIIRLRIEDSKGKPVYKYPNNDTAAKYGVDTEAPSDPITAAKSNPLDIPKPKAAATPAMIAPGQRIFIMNHARPDEVKKLQAKYGENLERMMMEQAKCNVEHLQKRIETAGASS